MSAGVARVGRPPATTGDALEAVAMRLFVTQGFDTTTVEDIAAAAGIGRRTFFRYFASKNDLVWGRFAEGLTEFREHLDGTPADLPTATALREAIVAFNALPPDQVPVHRQRMSLILTVSSLQAHSTLMYAEWRGIVAEFVATRVGGNPDDPLPRLAGHLMLGAAVAAYEQWLADPAVELTDVLDLAVARAGRFLDEP
ncbi:MAG: TetR/AcrR family transcriptional regulator, regulator of mycofactocin system [Frankiaceae bacterium]|jgi:mycofactocin system transcriptional regulator|nr:TetR/AcrR family transcriptional regulator, regulator of mycofactocin system [Frankiaceae bacterium]